MEHRDLLIPAGGSFGQGFPAQGPEHQWWEATNPPGSGR